ncbi:PIN domain-containing protein [Streptomyces sp. NPDC051985]|uniref:PIN domain-containing protein n=1 Tax=Streptomyces sp. NPDC051985 TaxID=3155807 RepID=UPI0034242FDD
MIILDTCVIRGLKLEDSSADLLRTLRAVGERVAIPWMVAEELLAQRVISYKEAHDAAAAAVEVVARHTPWKLSAQLEDADADRVRKYWRARYGTLAETLAPSETVMRVALSREANVLPPCKAQGKGKQGARDAVIWLTAIEYAREHPSETVCFVSSNTRDFTDGSAYPAPMDRDVAGLGDRFVHLTTLDEVIKRFTEPAETDEALAAEILGSPTVLKEIANTAQIRLSHAGEAFPCTTSAGDVGQEVTVSTGLGWFSVNAALSSADKVRAYRIGEHEWYTAVVRWRISGLAYLDAGELSIGSAGAIWTTSVLFTPDASNPRVTILRHDLPRPLSSEEFSALGLASTAIVPVAPILDLVQDMASQMKVGKTRQLPRAYEGALMKQARQTAIERRLKALLIDKGDNE